MLGRDISCRGPTYFAPPPFFGHSSVECGCFLCFSARGCHCNAPEGQLGQFMMARSIRFPYVEDAQLLEAMAIQMAGRWVLNLVRNACPCLADGFNGSYVALFTKEGRQIMAGVCWSLRWIPGTSNGAAHALASFALTRSGGSPPPTMAR